MASPASRTASASSSLLDKLLRRTLIGGIYPESSEYRDKLRNMLKRPATVYAGFDATSDSLHVGNLATIMNLLHFRSHGHRVICVVGDATAMVGDPSGHTKDRKILDKTVIDSNAKCIERDLLKLFTNHAKYYQKNSEKPWAQPLIIRNSTWYRDKNVIDFVSNVFRHVRVGHLLHKSSISERLKYGTGMNMSEFIYQILQAYDWLELNRMYNCNLQVGGSDQAGNIYTGHDYIKKSTGSVDSIGLLAPLITDVLTGKKLGKSSSKQTSIWLNSSKTSPYQFYQFFLRTPDEQVEKFLRVFTFYDDKLIEDFLYNNLKKPDDSWYCQRKLAENICHLVHGDDGLESAKRISHAFFEQSPMQIAMLSDSELDQLFEASSIITIVGRHDMRVLDLIKKANCFKNDMDAEQVVRAGGLKINGIKVKSFNALITEDLIIGNNVTIMKVGKRNFFLFKWR